MSFPRARIQRFNDVPSCAPAPGSYDPKFDAKVKGAVIEKSGRFVDPKYSSGSSSSNDSPANPSANGCISKASSMNCLPVFRTPQLPRRVMKISSAAKNKAKLRLDPSEDESSSKEVSTEYIETDQDKEIAGQENDFYVSELCERIRKLENDLSQLQIDQLELIERHNSELEEKDIEMNKKLELQNSELISIKCELQTAETDLKEIKENYVLLEHKVDESRTLVVSLEQQKEDLVSQIDRYKEKEEEFQTRYETDIRDLDNLCKKLVDEMTVLKTELDNKRKEEVKKLVEELSTCNEEKCDLDGKLAQKQQMILLVQSELSSTELELEECKSENEKLVNEMIELRTLITQLETLLEEERESRFQEIQTLEENVLNSSVVRENLETLILEKQSALTALNGKFLTLESEFEKCSVEHKLVAEAHRLEMDDIHLKHEEELSELKEKAEVLEKEAEKKIEDLETIVEESYTKHQLLVEAHRNEIETLNYKHNNVIAALKEEVSEKEASLEKQLHTLYQRYAALEGEFEKLCIVPENHKQELDDLVNKYEQQLDTLREKNIEDEKILDTKIQTLNEKCCALEEELEKSCIEQKLTTEAHKIEIEEIHSNYREELRDLQEKANDNSREMERRIKETMELSAKEAEERVNEVKTAAEENLNEVRNTAEKKIKEFEIEAAEKMKDCETRVEVKLKEAEQQMHESMEKAVQAEEDLRRMTHHRDELRISNMGNQLTIVELQDRIDTLVAELNTAKETYESELFQARSEVIATKKQCKKLKIGISNIQASLQALQMRLLDSEKDVEQLTNELGQYQSQKASLEEQVKMLTNELNTSKQSMTQLEAETFQQIEDTRRDLLCKLDEYKVKGERNIAAKEEEILEHRHRAEELSARIEELTESLSAMEETNTEHERAMEALTEKLDHQWDCAKIATQQIAALEASNAIYQHRIQALNSELDFQKDFSEKASEHIASLAAIKANQEKTISELAEEVETEREKSNKLRSEIEELKLVMNCSSVPESASLKDVFSRFEEEMRFVIQNLEGEVRVKDCDLEQKDEDIDKKEREIKDAKSRITELVFDNDCKQMQIEQHKMKIDELKSEIEQSKISLQDKMNAEFELKLEAKKDDLQRLADEANTKARDWEKRFMDMQQLIGPFRKQLEAFDAERKVLESQKEAAEGEMRDLGLRYAEILGHQNHKQKIKHVLKISEQNFELKKEVERLESQVRAQKRTIDKLKDEQRSMSARRPILQPHNVSSTKGKENVDRSPVPKSPAGSPSMKPLRTYR